MARRRIGITIVDRLDLFGLDEIEAGVVMSTIYKSKAISDQFSYKNGGLITGVILDLHEPNPNPSGPEPATTSGMSGIQGPLKDLPAFWGGGTYAQALAGTSKSIIRHDGTAKFSDVEVKGKIEAITGKVAGFDIVEEKLTTVGAGVSGFQGEEGLNISSITPYYGKSKDGLYPPSVWTTTIPTVLTSEFLWRYEKINYVGGSFYNSSPRVISIPGSLTISSITNYYLISNLSTGVTTSTTGWKTASNFTVTKGQYLWSYLILSRAGGPTTIAPLIISASRPALWAGGSYEDAINNTAKAIIRHDGSVKFKDADIEGRVIVEQSDGGKILMDATGLQIYNSLGGMNIRFGIKDGYSVMEYYDNEGNMLYDLGPNGITKLEVREEKWILTKLVFLGSSINAVLTNETAKEKYKTPGQQTETSYYKYVSKIVAGVNQNAGEDGRIFNSNGLLSGYIPAGVYMTKTVGMQKEYLTNGTNARIYPPGINSANEAVYDKSPLLFVQLRTYSFGVIDTTANAYWNTSFAEI